MHQNSISYLNSKDLCGFIWIRKKGKVLNLCASWLYKNDLNLNAFVIMNKLILSYMDSLNTQSISQSVLVPSVKTFSYGRPLHNIETNLFSLPVCSGLLFTCCLPFNLVPEYLKANVVSKQLLYCV